MTSPASLSRIDHLVYAADDLQSGIGAIEALLGVRAVPGGRHAAWGTHNALLALGPRCYLEIIAPDPDVAAPPRPRPFGLKAGAAQRLATWVANGTDLATLQASAAAAGVVLGGVLAGERQRPDGSLLRWTLTDPACVLGDGVVPFFIDWGASPHPASALPQGATLVGLRAEHPEPVRVRGMLGVLGLKLAVSSGAAPALVAAIDTPRGRVELR